VQDIPIGTLAYEKIREVLSGLPPGHELRVTVLRAGKLLDLADHVP
jgi:hypothetical protein